MKRNDRLAQIQLSLLNRRIVLSRFTPRVTYTFARRSSNIALYNFTQNRVEIGLSTVF